MRAASRELLKKSTGSIRYEGIKWERPKYEKIDLLPFIPREEDVDALVSGLYNRAAGTFCLLLKETGCRPVKRGRRNGFT